MKKVKETISSILAVAAAVFIIIASVVQWIPNTYYKAGREAKYTINYRVFLQNSKHFEDYVDRQYEEAHNEKD
ncbi:MAG: hypothetical protein Q4F70_01345 [Clostridia bacterium]|nr:hypothetical protein [Clostridia bacterium]